ncbi:MAG: SLC13/DASS family transporter [Acidobacteria bacterium]|nr:SLC13/DASS family transporter [Acidobacteriota bacterium]
MSQPPLPGIATTGAIEAGGTFGESAAMPAEVFSATERRFEELRRTIGFFGGPLVFLAVWFLPLPAVSVEAHRLAAIVSLVVAWWITEAIPIPATGLIGSMLTVLTGVATAQDAFAPFASPIIFVFIGSFMIGRAIAEHHLDRRLAFRLLSLGVVGGSLSRIRLALGLFGLFASAWIGNTALAAMMLPLAIGVLTATRSARGKSAASYETGVFLALAYAISIGGMMTPVGTAPNLIVIGLLDELAGVRINFFTWMTLGVPITLAMGAVLFGVAGRLYPVHRASGSVASFLQAEASGLGSMTAGERNCVIAFLTAVTLWLTPGVLAVLGLSDGALGKVVAARLDEGAVAIFAAGLLFLLPTDWGARRFTLDWRQAARIDWGTVLLFGAGLSLGRLMFVTGLAEYLGTALVRLSGAESLWGVTAMSIAIGILLTEITSNTAATNMLVPVVLTICKASGLHPVPPAVGACLATSVAFMLPISTPPNAMVYGTGRVSITDMIRFGLVLDVLGFFVIFAGLRLLCPLLGFV